MGQLRKLEKVGSCDDVPRVYVIDGQEYESGEVWKVDRRFGMDKGEWRKVAEVWEWKGRSEYEWVVDEWKWEEDDELMERLVRGVVGSSREEKRRTDK